MGFLLQKNDLMLRCMRVSEIQTQSFRQMEKQVLIVDDGREKLEMLHKACMDAGWAPEEIAIATTPVHTMEMFMAYKSGLKCIVLSDAIGPRKEVGQHSLTLHQAFINQGFVGIVIHVVSTEENRDALLLAQCTVVDSSDSTELAFKLNKSKLVS